jgi:hypothetical protein
MSGEKCMYVFKLDITELAKLRNGVMGDLGRDERAGRGSSPRSLGKYTINDEVKERKGKKNHEIRWDIHRALCPWLSREWFVGVRCVLSRLRTQDCHHMSAHSHALGICHTNYRLDVRMTSMSAEKRLIK